MLVFIALNSNLNLVWLNTFHSSCRVQYARWKDLCQALDSHVGSGRIITAPVITEDGQPIQDPLVLLEANPDQSKGQANGGSEAEPYLDKQVIEWKLTLHQIGMHLYLVCHCFVF